MSGHWYCNQNPVKENTCFFLKRRGSNYNYIKNNLGYAGSTNQAVENKNFILLHDGDVSNIASGLNGTTASTVEAIKSLTTQYALVFVNDDDIVFCTDQFSTKQLWFYYNAETKMFFSSSNRSTVMMNCGAAWRAEENQIYILHKSNFDIEKITNTEWNLKQTVNNYDQVFECFEQSVSKHHVHDATTFSTSAGFDTGAVGCAVRNLFPNTYPSMVTKPGRENTEILAQRLKIHQASVLIAQHPDSVTHITKLFEDLPYSFIDTPTANSISSMLIQHVVPKKHTVFIMGVGGDQLYSDYAHSAETGLFVKTSGTWPEQLDLIWPWHNFGKANVLRQVMRADAICGYYGVEARHPMLDRSLFQSWLNTTVDLKNRSYKDWMRCYMMEYDYPFNDDKTGMST